MDQTKWSFNYLVFLGIGLSMVSILNITHAFAFKGVDLFGSNTNLSTQIWIATQYLLAIIFVLAPCFIHRPRYNVPAFFSATAAIILIFLSVFYWKNFPVCYIEGSGLTPFKIYSECIIIALYAASIAGLWLNRRDFDQKIFKLIVASIIFAMAAEFSFTQYAAVYDFANMAGHILRLIGIYLLYWAIIAIGLGHPLDLMVKNLKVSNEKYDAIISNIDSAIAVYRPTADGTDFIFVDFNKAAEKIEKIKRSAVIGKKVTKVFPGVKSMGFFDILAHVHRTGEPEHFPLTFYKDKRISGWRENYVYKLSTGEIVAVYEDITDQKKSEEKIKEYYAQLDTMNKTMIGRELKMTELKEEIKILKTELTKYKQ